MTQHITGLVAAPHTPMHADGSVHLDLIDKLAGLLARNGVAGAFVCGSTGEGLSLSLDERMAVAQRWTAAAGRDLRVIIHVGATGLVDAEALAAHARKVGAWAIGVSPPTYFRPGSVEVLVDFCGGIAAAADPLPFYYYHIPCLTHVLFPMHEFLAVAGDRFGTMAGVKFTDEDLMDLRLCIELDNGRYDILFGRDEILLAGLALGVRGAVGSTYNWAAPLYRRIIEAFEAGDMSAALALQSKAVALVQALRMFAGKGLACGKAAMKLVGLDCGPARRPNQNLTAEQFAAYAQRLESIGFDEFRCRL